MNVIDRKPVPIYEAECSECHSKIQYRKSEASLGSINCPVCGIPRRMPYISSMRKPIRARLILPIWM